MRMVNKRVLFRVVVVEGDLTMLWHLRVRTHWTDKICLALPKISTNFVSAKFLIYQAWTH